jgi:drug/metabolite transporter (DMT)-like permease
LTTQQPFSFSALLWGVAAGVINAVALILYYQALSNSPAGIISPIVASGAVIPVLVSIVQGDVPTALTIIRLLTVLAGIIVCTSASDREANQIQSDAPSSCRGSLLKRWLSRSFRWVPTVCVMFAIASSLLSGVFFILIERGSTIPGVGVMWVTFGVQTGTIPITLINAVFVQKIKNFIPVRASTLSSVCPIIILNLMADVGLSYALTSNNLGVVSVLASLDPVVTVLFAQVFSGERLSRMQTMGASLTMTGTLLVISIK